MTGLPQLILDGLQRHPEARDASSPDDALDAMGLTGKVIRSVGFERADIECLLRHADDLQALTVPGVPDLVLTVPPEVALSLGSTLQSKYTRTRVALDRVLRQATSSVLLLAPYCHPGVVADLAGSLQEAIQNGATVDIVLQDDEGWDVGPFARKMLKVVPSARIRLIPSTAPRTHAKLVIVDDTTAYVGSGNLTPHGYGWNFEAGLITRGPHVGNLRATVDAYLVHVGPCPWGAAIGNAL